MRKSENLNNNTPDLSLNALMARLISSGCAKFQSEENAAAAGSPQPGDIIYVVGMTFGDQPDETPVGETPPHQIALGKASEQDLVSSLLPCADGGLGAAFARLALSSGLGMEIDLRKIPKYDITGEGMLLSTASPARFIATVSLKGLDAFQKIMGDTPWARTGFMTTVQSLNLTGLNGKPVYSEKLSELEKISTAEPHS